MNEPHLCYTKQIYLYLDGALQFRLSSIRKIEDFFIVRENDRLKTNKTLH